MEFCLSFFRRMIKNVLKQNQPSGMKADLGVFNSYRMKHILLTYPDYICRKAFSDLT